jgi:hypothetical protein
MEDDILAIGEVLPCDCESGESEKDATSSQHRAINHSHRWAKEATYKEDDGHREANDEYILICVSFLHRLKPYAS